MTREQARETARDILQIIPLVMRTVAAELREAGQLPAPAQFGLLSILSERPRILTELASLQGVSLPTMSSSVSAMVERGWVRRAAPVADRRIVLIEVTTAGRAALDRVARSAETHLADVLAPLDAGARRRLQGGLGVLHRVFAAKSARSRREPVSLRPVATGRRKSSVAQPFRAARRP
jgi:DNA-binding MarR family transcriptional regulator